MGRQARAVHISRSVSTFASVALVPALASQPRRRSGRAYWRELLGVGYVRANGLVGQLVSAGVLAQYDDSSYNRRFAAPDVLAVILR